MMNISGFARQLRAALLCAGLASAFSAQAVVFSNSAPISIPDSGPATPYPSTIAVSGLTGPITKVTATLNGLTHTCNSDLVVLLVGPQGQSLILMANTGSCSDPGETTFTYTFDDAYGAMPDGELPPDSGSYAPTDNFVNSETMTARPTAKARPTGPTRVVPTGYLPSPAPADAPTGSSLSTFNGSSGNGTWSLYVLDDAGGDSGTITDGWSLDITAPAAATATTAIPTLGEWSLILLATLLAGITALRLRRDEH